MGQMGKILWFYYQTHYTSIGFFVAKIFVLVRFVPEICLRTKFGLIIQTKKIVTYNTQMTR